MLSLDVPLEPVQRFEEVVRVLGLLGPPVQGEAVRVPLVGELLRAGGVVADGALVRRAVVRGVPRLDEVHGQAVQPGIVFAGQLDDFLDGRDRELVRHALWGTPVLSHAQLGELDEVVDAEQEFPG
ncbi:hypothetical protein GCM10011609_27530 [Lentzea pudingi]|uniref:Uncharacterized protein n=1 Tax=Lentzea pudingi TaxID=1789439 RepID=A0ABQ2HT91_9PSEU|nr:hypothetical protein [Lentzea pudingi]GGM89184.1 hypothetical protein GCM10011609_27530 [Lentzea pudingi]